MLTLVPRLRLTLEQRNRLIEESLPLARKVADILERRFPINSPIRADCYSECCLLLVQAAVDFKPWLNVPFPLYAKRILYWRIYDGIRRRKFNDLKLRQFCDVPKGTDSRGHARTMPSAEDDNPDRAAPVRKPVIRNINSHGEISRKSTHNSRNENEIIARIDSERATAATRKAVIALREPESMVIGLLYQGDLVQSQVGEILGVAQSRVSQIKHSGLRKLRARPELRKLAA